MKVTELNKRYDQPGVQVKNTILYITSDGISETVHGYVIACYDQDGAATEVYGDTAKSAPMTANMKIWDDAHDALYGVPKAPEAGRQLIKADEPIENGGVSVHDITVNGVNYILQWTHSEEGAGHISITEAVAHTEEHDEDEECPGCTELETYDFDEVEQ